MDIITRNATTVKPLPSDFPQWMVRDITGLLSKLAWYRESRERLIALGKKVGGGDRYLNEWLDNGGRAEMLSAVAGIREFMSEAKEIGEDGIGILRTLEAMRTESLVVPTLEEVATTVVMDAIAEVRDSATFPLTEDPTETTLRGFWETLRPARRSALTAYIGTLPRETAQHEHRDADKFVAFLRHCIEGSMVRCVPNNFDPTPTGVFGDQPETVTVQGSKGTDYTVTLGDAPTCSCPDFLYRGTNMDGSTNGHRCKHLRAALAPIVTVAACSPVAEVKPATADALIIEAVDAYRSGGTGALSIVLASLSVHDWNSIGRRLVALGCPRLGKGVDRRSRLTDFCRLASEGSPVSFLEASRADNQGMDTTLNNAIFATLIDASEAYRAASTLSPDDGRQWTMGMLKENASACHEACKAVWNSANHATQQAIGEWLNDADHNHERNRIYTVGTQFGMFVIDCVFGASLDRKPKPWGPKITDRHICHAKMAAAADYGLAISFEQARLTLLADLDLLDELESGPNLDTRPRYDLGAAILEWLMPGRPDVQDDMIKQDQTFWVWPCFGSSDEYREAFARRLGEAMRLHGVSFVDDADPDGPDGVPSEPDHIAGAGNMVDKLFTAEPLGTADCEMPDPDQLAEFPPMRARHIEDKAACRWCGAPGPIDDHWQLCDRCRPIVPKPEGAEPMMPNHALLAMHGLMPVCGGGPEDYAGLPQGMTCSDCAHFKPKCSWFISSLTGAETRCDWAPSRFRPKPIAGGSPEESIDERVDYLTEDQCRVILKQIIQSLVDNGTVDGTLDILHENCLLTMREARQMFRKATNPEGA